MLTYPEIKVFPSFSEGNTRYQAKIVKRPNSEKPELIFLKTFFKKGELFSTTKLGRISRDLALYMNSCTNSFLNL